METEPKKEPETEPESVKRANIDPNLRLLAAKNPHERDVFIKYEEKDHKYFVDIQRDGNFTNEHFISVTTLKSVFFAEFDADAIIPQMMAKDTFAKRHSDLVGMTPEEIKAFWKENGRQSAEAGTKIHAEIECILNEEKDLVCTTPEMKLFKEFTDMASEAHEPYRTEMFVFTDDTSRVAGAIDALYVNVKRMAEPNPENALYVKIVDWKRVKKLNEYNPRERGIAPFEKLPNTNYFHYCVQQNMYKYILETFYKNPVWNGRVYSHIVVEKMWLCRLYPNMRKVQLKQCEEYPVEIKRVFEMRAESLQKRRQGLPDIYPFDKNLKPEMEVVPGFGVTDLESL